MSLSAKELCFQYNSNQVFKFPDFHLDEGQNLLILGKSGKGKTTFLHLLAGILRADQGTIKISNINICELSPRKMDRFRGRNIGLVFQKSYFIRSVSVKDNLLLAQKLAGKKQDETLVAALSAEMDLSSKLQAMPSDLSVGEQQRVSIARAVINSPALILADEPTSALDDENAIRVAELLEKIASSRKANLVVVTHDERLKNRFQNIIRL